MKGKLLWFIGILQVSIGSMLSISAQAEILTNSRYTWTRPYTSYETKIITSRWVGILLIISGIIWIGLKLFQIRYANKHIQEVSQSTKSGNIIKCPNCELTLSAGTANCPRCGKPTSNNDINSIESNSIRFCSKCGNQISANESFCTKCGNQISK